MTGALTAGEKFLGKREILFTAGYDNQVRGSTESGAGLSGGPLGSVGRTSGAASPRARLDVDTVSASRLAAAIAVVVAIVESAYLLLHAPTHIVGSAGWALAALLIVGLAAAGGLTAVRRLAHSAPRLVLFAYAGMAQAALICALTRAESHRQLIFLWLAFCVAISPPARGLLALAFAYLSGGLPLIGLPVSSTAAEQLLADAVLWALVAALLHLLLTAVRQQRSDFRSSQRRLHELAHRDPLTGIGNRRALDVALVDLDEQVQEDGRSAAVAIFDIENFKQINDRDGLRAGDRCLRNVAEALHNAVPAAADAFRLGGDEFVVLLPGHDLAAARRAAAGLEEVVAAACHGADGQPLGSRWGLCEVTGEVKAIAAMTGADLELLALKAEPGVERRRGDDRRGKGDGDRVIDTV